MHSASTQSLLIMILLAAVSILHVAGDIQCATFNPYTTYGCGAACVTAFGNECYCGEGDSDFPGSCVYNPDQWTLPLRFAKFYYAFEI